MSSREGEDICCVHIYVASFCPIIKNIIAMPLLQIGQFWDLFILFEGSRQTVVCRAAQKASAPHLWVINRKNNNAIFTHT